MTRNESWKLLARRGTGQLHLAAAGNSSSQCPGLCICMGLAWANQGALHSKRQGTYL